MLCDVIAHRLHRERLLPCAPLGNLCPLCSPLRSLYRYRFVDASEQAPVIEGEPQTALVPYQRTVFELERRGGTYIVTGVKYEAGGKERQARFSAFTEIAPGRYRPQQMVVVGEGGRTEVTFSHWTVRSAPESQLFTPAHLETPAIPGQGGKG